jgi:hypothetical protein
MKLLRTKYDSIGTPVFHFAFASIYFLFGRILLLILSQAGEHHVEAEARGARLGLRPSHQPAPAQRR